MTPSTLNLQLRMATLEQQGSSGGAAVVLLLVVVGTVQLLALVACWLLLNVLLPFTTTKMLPERID